MKKHRGIVVGIASIGAILAPLFLAPVSGVAQNPLPPGTQSPDDQPSGSYSTRAEQAADLAEAEDKIDRADFEGARSLVEKYLSGHPGDARALFDLGYLDQATHQDDAAAEEYGKAIAADPKQFESRLALGLLLAKQGKTDAAREQLAQATLLTPSPPNPAAQAQAFRALAELERTSDPEAARDELLSALRISPETPQDMVLTAQIAEAAGDKETAESAYRRVLTRYPKSAQASAATGGLAQLLVEQQKYDEAEPLIESALERDPANPALNAQLAAILIAQKKSAAALPVLEKLRQLEPKDTAVDEMLADAYVELGYPEKADPIYSEMAEARPADPAILAAQGRNLILEKRYPEAQLVLEKSLRLKPDDGEAWSGLAFAAVQDKQYPVALEALSMRAKYLPESPSSLFLRAVSYDNLHQVKSAGEYYRKFLAVSGGKFPDQEWQAHQRLAILAKSR